MGLAWTAVNFVLLGAGALQASTHAFRQPRGMARILGAIVIGWTWLTVGMECLGSWGFLTREALLGWSTAGFALGVASRINGRPPEDHEKVPDLADSWRWEEVTALGLVVWGSLVLGTTSLFYWVKVVSDGPIYHLYFAARWWKSHRLDLIPIPFGESAAPYFPAIGDLWYTWLMVCWGGDRLAKVGQAPFFVIAGLTVFGLATRLGTSRNAAIVATSWFLTATPFLLFSFEANVDTILVAGYLLAVYFFTRYILGDDSLPALWLGSFAAGSRSRHEGNRNPRVRGRSPCSCSLIVFAVLVKNEGRGRKIVGLGIVWLAPFVVSGFWYVRDYRLTGNPLYPLHLQLFGRVWLAGWYGPGVMQRSRYYIPFLDWRALVDQVVIVLDPRMVLIWCLALAGGWSWRRSKRSPEDVVVWAIAALAVANVAAYWIADSLPDPAAIHGPRRGSRRDSPGTVVQSITLAQRARRRLASRLTLTTSSPLAQCPSPDLPGTFSLRIPNDAPQMVSAFPVDRSGVEKLFRSSEAWMAYAARDVTGVAAILVAWIWLRSVSIVKPRRRLLPTLSTSALLLGASVLFYPWNLDERVLFLPGFREYYRGWIEVDLRSGKNGIAIAYAGTDLPYYLMGVGLRNDVRYVNIDAHRNWLMHDYHLDASRSGSATWNHPRPGWDRIHPDYDAWLANLRAEGIQLLFVTRANPDEGPHNIADESQFPIEHVWANGHPEAFEAISPGSERRPVSSPADKKPHFGKTLRKLQGKFRDLDGSRRDFALIECAIEMVQGLRPARLDR